MTMVIAESGLFEDGVVPWVAVRRKQVVMKDGKATLATIGSMTARAITHRQVK